MTTPPTYYGYCRNEMTPLLPERYSRVLEVGCGEGKFRDHLSREHEYWGVEPDPSAATMASERLDRVLTGTYEEAADRIPNNHFDLIICNDVIEHMSDHDEFFRSIRVKLTPDGYLVASIPNVRYLSNLFEILVKKDWKYKDDGVLDRQHLRFFTKKSLIRTINDNGFVIDRLAGINPYRARSAARRCLYYFAVLLFGGDVRFLQFGVRAQRSQGAQSGPSTLS